MPFPGMGRTVVGRACRQCPSFQAERGAFSKAGFQLGNPDGCSSIASWVSTDGGVIIGAAIVTDPNGAHRSLPVDISLGAHSSCRDGALWGHS